MSEFILGDCMEYMKNMADNEFELAIVDPPYGIGINQMRMGSRETVKPSDKKWDDNIPSNKYFDELMRVSKNQIIWGGNYFNLHPSRAFVIWDKGESMYGRSFAECEYAWVSIDSSAKIYKLNPIQLERFHPTQKPVALYKWLIKNYAKQGDKILDTHVGSASSLIACYEMGFEYTGFEIDEEYYNKAVERLEAVKAQTTIFDLGIEH